MSIKESKIATVVFCRGKLRATEEAEYFTKEVEALLIRCPRIVVQLERLTYIDSSGIGTLVGLRTKALASGGDVRLACVTDHTVRYVLQITKMGEVFHFYDNEEQALSSFAHIGKVDTETSQL